MSRRKQTESYRYWTEAEEKELLAWDEEGKQLQDFAKRSNRTAGKVRQKLAQLNRNHSRNSIELPDGKRVWFREVNGVWKYRVKLITGNYSNWKHL